MMSHGPTISLIKHDNLSPQLLFSFFAGLLHFEKFLKPIHRDFLLQLKIMKAIESRISERSNLTKKNQKFEPVSVMKKLRSKIPRRKRFQISPILGESSSNSLYRVEKRKPNDEVSSVLIPDEISCTSNLISVGSETLQEFKLSLKQQQQKKKQVVISETENCSDDRRIINRYCYKRKEIEATATEKVSESNSCGVVFSGDEFSGRKWKSRARKVDENDEGGNNHNVSEAISFSETSCIQSVYSSIKNSRKNFKSEEEFTSNDSSVKKAKVEIQGGDGISEIFFVPKSNSEPKNENQFDGDENRAPVASISDLSNLKFADSESTAINQKPEDCESDCELICSEDYSYDAEESDYSKTISDLDSEFSDYVGTSLYDSESQTDFSQGSDLNPTAYYSFLTEYSKEFSRLSSVASSDCKISSQIHKDYSEKLTYLKFEDENDEDSYIKFRSRERNHVILKDYFEDYYTTTAYGDFLLQERQAILNWIIDESGLRELNLETVFLCVSLMDRFLSQGFFKTKRKLQLLGIACLTLATRIEENQMYNW
ncbi:cyclin-SDS-like [Papaver somniferum]|uniref:cyclin-SDS-like n=1 Tax=Papaver somniferum TaxID=3469 RepID=UPI000E6FFD00|nr:cyclin-SDS-like [Papaver somniferum]